jgi:hypothetical protein
MNALTSFRVYCDPCTKYLLVAGGGACLDDVDPGLLALFSALVAALGQTKTEEFLRREIDHALAPGRSLRGGITAASAKKAMFNEVKGESWRYRAGMASATERRMASKSVHVAKRAAREWLEADRLEKHAEVLKEQARESGITYVPDPLLDGRVETLRAKALQRAMNGSIRAIAFKRETVEAIEADIRAMEGPSKRAVPKVPRSGAARRK